MKKTIGDLVAMLTEPEDLADVLAGVLRSRPFQEHGQGLSETRRNLRLAQGLLHDRAIDDRCKYLETLPPLTDDEIALARNLEKMRAIVIYRNRNATADGPMNLRDAKERVEYALGQDPIL